MAELVPNGKHSTVRLTAYEAEVLASWGQRQWIRDAQKEQPEQSAKQLLQQIVEYLEGRQIRVY